MYRTRVGTFELADRESRAAESRLCEALDEWREDLVAGGDLQSSALERQHATSVHKHFQFEGRPQSEEADDHQSPVQPQRYIELRMRPAMAFYQARIPRYTRRSGLLTGTLLLCTVAASVLARFRLSPLVSTLVVLVSAATTATTAWKEFADTKCKTSRYSRAVRNIN